MSADLDHLGPALRLMRQARHLKQYELAKRAGLTKAQASSYERGRRQPSLRNLVAFLHALGADFGHLQQALRIASRSPSHRESSHP